MSVSSNPLFPSRGKRGYDVAAVETFPWPVVVGYDDVHRWMDQGQAVHAAWQLRDVWEGLIKFLATLALADQLATAADDDPRTSKLLALLLKPQGLSMGDWATLMEIALKDGSLPQARLPALGPLLFPHSKPGPLFRMFVGDKTSFVRWRNECFAHGVFRRDLGRYAEDALHWLNRLHEAFDVCRLMFESLTLQSEGPKGEIHTWGQHPPLPFYHAHQPASAGLILSPVWLRQPEKEAIVLSPLLSVQHCEVCGHWAAFYLDKYERDKHRARFLDFVEGHSNAHKNLEPLRRWTERVSEVDAYAAATGKLDPEERGEPAPERFRDFQYEFEPPVYLARQIADFLQAHDCGVVALIGPSGVGQTWATQGLDHAGMLSAVLGRQVHVLFISMHGATVVRANEIWTNLAEYARRVKRWQVPAWPDGPEPYTRFAAWLAALMQANGIGELVVALDGLDELPEDSDVPDLWPPAGHLPPKCYLVLSSRPSMRAAAESGMNRVRSMINHFRELRVGPEDPQHRAVLLSYVAKRLNRPRPNGEGPLPAAWAGPLIDLAGGSFLYTYHFCQALHYGIYTDLTQLPPPASYYPAFFEHLLGRVGNELFENHYAKALALIAVAREPVSMTHLSAWGLNRSRLIVILDDLADLLRTRREPWDAETLYSLGHDTIRLYLTEDPAWHCRLAGANQFLTDLAIQRFGSDWSAVDPLDPVEGYLLFHVFDHATELRRSELLADTALADACLTHGNALFLRREFALSLQAYGMALNLRKNQVWRQGHRELREELSSAYMHRGNSLLELGRPEESLAEYESAVRLCEELVNQEGCNELRGDLAYAHLYRGRTLGHLGRLDQAIADHDVAIGLYEQMVHWENRSDLRVHLAMAYMNRGIFQKQLGRLADALDDYNSCIALREEHPELRDQLAAAYASRGTTLADLGRLDDALADYDAAIKLEEELVHREERSELRHNLALSYMNRSVALTDLGRLEEALDDSRKCISLEEQLVRQEGHRELRNSLAMAYLNRGRTLGNLGRGEEALSDYEASIKLREELVHGEGRRELRNDLAHAYMLRGCDLHEMGRLEKAIHDYDASISLREELVHGEGRRELRNDLAIAYMNRGIGLTDLGRLEEALPDYRKCISLEEELVNRDGRHDLAGQLAWGYARHADLLLRMGRREQACRQSREAVTILETEVSRTGRADLREVLEFAKEVARNACG